MSNENDFFVSFGLLCAHLCIVPFCCISFHHKNGFVFLSIGFYFYLFIYLVFYLIFETSKKKKQWLKSLWHIELTVQHPINRKIRKTITAYQNEWDSIDSNIKSIWWDICILWNVIQPFENEEKKIREREKTTGYMF